jgi:hypothetical protein
MMTKRKGPPTAASTSGQKDTGQNLVDPTEALQGISTTVKATLDGINRSMADFAAQMVGYLQTVQALNDEAEALFAAVDGADLPTIEQYVSKHPPSPGAIGFLVLITRDRYKSEIARKNAMKRILAREPAKKWLLAQWTESGTKYKSRADFSRVMHDRLKQEFPEVEITARTIEREWLPKGSGKDKRSR